MSNRKMHLVAYLKTGPTALHSGGWRHPEATLEDIFDPVRYEQSAQLLEAARFDGAFFADLFGVADTYKGLEMFVRSGGQNSYLDPMMVLPIMARVTRHLGLGSTISTTFQNVFQIARSLASVDILSGGRVAWNVVTSTNDLEAKNAGIGTMPPHEERYDRAEEVLEACMALWRTWDRDPFVFDKDRGIFADPEKVHYANYVGKWTSTRGPLPTPQSPQAHPVIMQAGSSERGRAFAARWAEIIFVTESTKETLRDFRADMNSRLQTEGRDPSSCKILSGMTPIVGETDSIARDRAEYLDSLQDPNYDLAYASLSVGADLSKHKTAQEVAAARGNQGTRGTSALLSSIAEKEKVTLAEVAKKRRRNNDMTGTPARIADAMQDLFDAGSCDGFIVMPIVHPTSHEQFCRAVVPELQRRGIFRKEYSATTLRGNLMGA
jgi:FMN-dependent oxidoreductase (nitrilotriacetate monooxygenase family)